MSEESTTIVIYEESFPAIRNETVETTVASAIGYLQDFGEATNAIQLNETVTIVEEDDPEKKKDQKKKIKYKHKCLFYEECTKAFESQEEMVDHMVVDHEVEKDHLLLQEFNSFEDFEIWKDHLELDNYVYYTRRNKQDRRYVYYCCRDGQPKPGVKMEDVDQETKTMLRKTKLKKKYGLNCPSKMIARVLDTEKVELIFYKIHSHLVCLEETQHHPVPHLLKQELFAQLALNASIDEIHAMLHAKETSIYPIYKAVIRDLNRRRLRKIGKDFQQDISSEHLAMWKRIRPLAQKERIKGPAVLEENKALKLVSVQHKLEQLYHLLDESVTQNLLLNYMDASLSKLLKECSAAFAVSDTRFPLEDECILKYKPDVIKDCEETPEMDTSEPTVNDYSGDQSRELVIHEENLMDQGVKRKIEDDNIFGRKRKNLGHRENNQPNIDPITGIQIGIKIKQNRKKLFKVPQRPKFPGPPIRTLDTIIIQPGELNLCDKGENPKASDCSSNMVGNSAVTKNKGECSSNVCSETPKADGSVTAIGDGSTTSGAVTSREVLEQLQSDANEIQERLMQQSVQMEVGKVEKGSVDPQLLEIVSLAKAMVDGECSSDQVIILDERHSLTSNVFEEFVNAQ